MRISQIYSNISFRKKLVAKAAVSAANESLSCKIYKLSSEKDKLYFDKMPNLSDWEESDFINAFREELEENPEGKRIYALEDKDENCLGLIELYDNDLSKRKSIAYLETCPKNSAENKKRNIKYIGETMLAFATALAKKEKSSVLTVPIALQSAEAFYIDKCGFMPSISFGLALFGDMYEKLIDKNAEHTDRKIKLVI